MPRLHVTLPDGSDVTHELTEDVITVGRVSDNTIQIEDASVSSHHAEMVLRESSYSVKDLGSTNGSRLNDKPLAAEVEMQLQHGDRLLFGSIAIRYLSEVDADQQPLPAEAEQPTLAPATNSVAPADFANASPFPKKDKQRDKAGMAAIAVGALALLAAGGAVALVMGMKSPL